MIDEVVECDMRTIGVYMEDVGDCIKWRFRTQMANLKIVGIEAKEKTELKLCY